jgi:hypothetical protein
MSAYATKVAEGFSQKVLEFLYENAPIDSIVNRDYEGEINQVGSILNILTLQKLSEKTYSGTNLTADDLTESNAQLKIDQQKSFYWKEKTIDRWASYIKNPHGTVVQQAANERRKNIMTFILGFWADTAAGQAYGTDYTTGTVTVDVTTGAVTGSGTTFTSAMVRVKSYSSTTAIVIEDDSDDLTSAYTGGAISGGTAYVVQANTAKVVDNTTYTFLAMVLQLKRFLDEAEVPDEDRFLVVPAIAETRLLTDTGIKLSVPDSYSELVKQGFLTDLAGFKVFRSQRIAGDNTNGYRVIAGHKSFLTFADKALEVGMEEDLIGNFGTAYKDLFVYGAKVADNRRKFGAQALVTF